jgi:hypothetical protein
VDTLIRFNGTILIAVLLASTGPAAAAEPTVAEAGARYGQAQSVTKFCPAGVLTEKARTLKSNYVDDNAKVFDAEAVKVVEGWDKAFACKDRDPDTHKITQCGKMKLTSCRQAWLEIGPDGKAIPGLIELNLENWGKEE